MSYDTRQSPFPHLPGSIAFAYCVLNWLVPGAVYLAARDFRRGALLFLIINGIFVTGLLYDGYIYVPPFLWGMPNFNVVALLTFIVEVCAGGPTLLVLFSERAGGLLESTFVRPAGSAYSDLGAFHFLVAGGLNYFATTRLYDFLTGYAEVQEKREEAKKKEESAEPDGAEEEEVPSS